MKKTHYLMVLLFLFSGQLWAEQISQWQKKKQYQRGDLVEHQQLHFIALLPSKAIAPKKTSIVWRPIALNSTANAKVGKLYLLGSVININQQKYIARSLTIFKSDNDLADTRKWFLFQGEPSNPDLPEDQEYVELLGEDKNNNGIRDDFEQLVITSDLTDEVKEYALAAGKNYSDFMRMSLTKEKITAEEAILINQQMINITRCHGQLMANNEKAWNKSDFFNTIDRLETLYLFGNYLMNLTEDFRYKFSEDACKAII